MQLEPARAPKLLLFADLRVYKFEEGNLCGCWVLQLQKPFLAEVLFFCPQAGPAASRGGRGW